MITLTNRIDMRPGVVPLVIHLGQYDSDFSLVFELYSSAGNFTVESGTTAMIRGTKTDGNAYDADATLDVSAKTVTVVGSEQMTAAKGRNVYELVLTKSGKVLSTANFILDVERAAMDADTIASESVLKELNAIIAGAETATEAAQTATAAADSVSSASAQIATNTADISNLKEDLNDVNSNIKSLERNRVYMYNSTNAETVNMAYPFKGGHSYKLSPAITSWSWKTPASGRTLFEILSINSEQPDSSLYKKTISDGSIDQTIYIDVPKDSIRVLVAFRAVKGTYFDIDVVDLGQTVSTFTSRYYGRRVSIIGDSIDTFDQTGYKINGYSMYYPYGDVTDVNQTWWMKIINASGAKLEVNASYAGSCVTTYHQSRPDLYARTSLIGNPDLIFVALGTNDSTHNVALGDYDYTTAYQSLSEATFRTAYIKGIKALQALYPQAEIVCIVESMQSAYEESIRNIAKTLSVGYVDISEYTGNDVHPDAYGMRKIASKVLNNVDDFLFQRNVPADAKATGDAINEIKTFLESLTRKILVIKNDRDQHTDNNDIYLEPGHTYIAVPSATSWEYTTPTSGPTLFAIASYRRDVSTGGTFETILYRKTNSDGSIDSEIRFTVPAETDYIKVTVREKYGASLSVTFYDLGESNYLDTYQPLANISVSSLDIFKRGEYVWYEGTKGSTKTPIVNARSIYDGGPAYSDISPVIYENGEPIIKDNKMYYAKTSYWQLGGTGCTIYEYDIGTGELHLSGMVGGYEIVNGSETMYSIVATHIMYNRNTGEWQYTSTGAGDDSHTLHYSHSYNSPLHGCTILEFRKLTYANAKDGDEDGFVFYSDELQKWVLVYCKLVNNVYRVCLQTSDYCDDGFTQYSVNNNVTGTGVNICKVNNTRYVLSGDTAQNNVNRFAVLSFPDLTFVCYLNLNYNNGGFRTWNTLIPVPDGEFTSYYLLTFDRAIQSPAWNWSYGNVYMYRAKERNNGLEYPLYVNGQEIAHPIQGGTDVNDLHLQLLWAKPFVSNEEIVLSEINLDNNVRRSNSNIYQAVGDALEQTNTGLVLTSSGEAKIYGGQHQPGAVYILPTKNIGKNDYRYIQICDYNGTVYLQVSAKGNREVYIKGYNYSETLAGSLSVDDGELLIYTGGGKVNVYSRHSR